MAAADVKAPAVKTDYRMDNATFRARVEAQTAAFRNLMKIAAVVYSKPPGEKAEFKGSKPIGRRELNTLIAEFAGELDNNGKIFTASNKGKKPRAGGAGGAQRGQQLKALFYISDQLVGFLSEANYGNGLARAFTGQDAQYFRANGKLQGQQIIQQFGAAAILNALQQSENAAVEAENKALREKGQPATRVAERVTQDVLASIDVSNALDLVLNRHMATSAILISLFALITTVNGLQSKTNGQRNNYDDVMQKWFDRGTNTRWVLNGRDLTPASVPQGMAATKVAKFQDNLANVNLSAFDRLRQHADQKVRVAGTKQSQMVKVFIDKGQQRSGDDWGYLHSMTMVISMYFRIPAELVDQSALKLPQNVNDAAALQSYIHGLLQAHRALNLPAKKLAQAERRRIAAAQKRATQPASGKRGGRKAAGAKAAAAGPAAVLPL